MENEMGVEGERPRVRGGEDRCLQGVSVCVCVRERVDLTVEPGKVRRKKRSGVGGGWGGVAL